MSCTDIKYDSDVSRWQPNARGRLEQAALRLYAERGFEQTTIAEIAREATLTERTFFRYFADKREVLFWDAQHFEEFLVQRVLAAPESLGALEAVESAFEAAGAQLEVERDSARERHGVIGASADLQERELMKFASVSSALAHALVRRGEGSTTASLAALTGVAAFRVAFDRWILDTEVRGLSELVGASFPQLRDGGGAVAVDATRPRLGDDKLHRGGDGRIRPGELTRDDPAPPRTRPEGWPPPGR